MLNNSTSEFLINLQYSLYNIINKQTKFYIGIPYMLVEYKSYPLSNYADKQFYATSIAYDNGTLYFVSSYTPVCIPVCSVYNVSYKNKHKGNPLEKIYANIQKKVKVSLPLPPLQ